MFIYIIIFCYICTPELMEIGNLKKCVSALNKAFLRFSDGHYSAVTFQEMSHCFWM